MRFVCAALVLVSTAQAQVNTERLRRALDQDGVTASLDAAAAFATGNTDYLRVGLGGRVDGRLGQDRAFAVGRFDVSRADGASYLDRSFLHARYSHRLAPRLDLETFAQIERNRQQRLVARTLFGLGARVDVLDRDSAGLAVGLTPMFEHEELDAELGETSGVVRVSSYASGRLALAPATAFSLTAYVQPRLDRPDDLRVLGQAVLQVAVTRVVQLRLQSNLRIDSRPPEGVEPTDFSIENGLVLVLPVR